MDTDCVSPLGAFVCLRRGGMDLPLSGEGSRVRAGQIARRGRSAHPDLAEMAQVDVLDLAATLGEADCEVRRDLAQREDLAVG